MALTLCLGNAAAAVAGDTRATHANRSRIGLHSHSVNFATNNNQFDLMAYKSWLIRQPNIYKAGLVETANYAATRSVMFLWAGGKNRTLAAIKAEAAARGIKTSVRPVRYSRSQLDEGMSRLLASAKKPSWSGFHIASISGTDLTHDGLTVEGYFPNSVKHVSTGRLDAVAQTVLHRAPALRSLASNTVALNVIVGPSTTLFSTRSTDTTPFNAGGLMSGPGGYICSSGFAINFKGQTHTVTARHCNDVPYHAFSLSTSLYRTTAIDFYPGAARLLTAHGAGYMFDGAYNNPDGYAKPVTGFADLSLNDYVYTSGGNSGVHGNIKVTNLDEYYEDGTYGYVQTIRGIQQNGSIAAAQGDSGGPVLVPDGNGGALAAGMIQGTNGRTFSSCGPEHVKAICSSEVEFTSMRTIVNGFAGATLVLARNGGP